MEDARSSGERAWWRRKHQSLFDSIGAAVVLALTVANADVIEPHQKADHSQQAEAVLQSPEPWMESQEVVYEVEGIARTALVTMETPAGTVQDFVSLPLKDEPGEVGIRMRFPRGAYVSVSGQNRVFGGAGTVTCRITVDGTVISEHTSSGLYATASCAGNA